MGRSIFSPCLTSVFCDHQKNNHPVVHDRSPSCRWLLVLLASLSILTLKYFWWEDKYLRPSSGHWTTYMPCTREQVRYLQNCAGGMWRMWCESPHTTCGNTYCAETWAISCCASFLEAEPFLMGPRQTLSLHPEKHIFPFVEIKGRSVLQSSH